tara:strand:+ start:1822 stop:2022 length:201 start_codon:yes stop_codon:yes gene_type:complete
VIPASFIPMIAKFVLGDKILPKIMDHIAKVYKLDKVLNYMELPNDADNRIDKLEEQLKMLAKKIDE